MPPGTPPDSVLAAVQNFARDEFALQHRYVMALHTDERQPHVHVVVKALSERGERLHIRKATLRLWRSEFARHLREQGVRANATDRLARGRVGRNIPDGLFRLRERGASTRVERSRPESVAAQQALQEVRAGWEMAAELFRSDTERQRERHQERQPVQELSPSL